MGTSHFVLARTEQRSATCEVAGWFPEDFGLKDHSIFVYEGAYYLVSIYLPGEKTFAYARTQDFCAWEDLSPILTNNTGAWDSLAIWAPHVLENEGVYYMYYTGVKGPYPFLTQSIMLATTTNPADPHLWAVEGMLFQPDHPGMVWEDGAWANCRDPHVFKIEDTFYMLYTGEDLDGGIVGLATAPSPRGPWQDLGSILTLEGAGIPESPALWPANGGFYLIYNRAGAGAASGEKYRFGPTLTGPWSQEASLTPGWAHEIWSGLDAQTYTSYLTDYTVTIQPLIWNTRFDPPLPFIGAQILEWMLPVVVH